MTCHRYTNVCYETYAGISWFFREFALGMWMAENLTFIVLHHYMDGVMPMSIVHAVCFSASYVIAFVFSKLLIVLYEKRN